MLGSILAPNWQCQQWASVSVPRRQRHSGEMTRVSMYKKKRSRALRPSKKILWRLLYLPLKDLIICQPNGCSSKLFGDCGCGAKRAVMGSWQDYTGHWKSLTCHSTCHGEPLPWVQLKPKTIAIREGGRQRGRARGRERLPHRWSRGLGRHDVWAPTPRGP